MFEARCRQRRSRRPDREITVRSGSDVAESHHADIAGHSTCHPVLLLVACSDDLEVKPLYNPANGRVVIQIEPGRQRQAALRPACAAAASASLDCKKLAAETARRSRTRPATRIDGPFVDPALTKPFYDGPSGCNPTPEMLEQLKLGTDSIIDVCLMDGNEVVVQIERDLFRAWDDARKQGLGGKADDPTAASSASTARVAYGERCIARARRDSVLREDRRRRVLDVRLPRLDRDPDDGHRRPTASVDDAARRHGQPVRQPAVHLLAVRGRPARRDAHERAGHALGAALPQEHRRLRVEPVQRHRDDRVTTRSPARPASSRTRSTRRPTAATFRTRPTRRSRRTCGAACTAASARASSARSCHDADPFIHTPWIDGAKDAQGRPIVPKMGIDADLALGANDTPYALVNAKRPGLEDARSRSSRPRRTRASSATAWAAAAGPIELICAPRRHRLVVDRHHDRDVQPGRSTSTGCRPTRVRRPRRRGRRRRSRSALDFIKSCGDNPIDPACIWKDIPTTLGGDDAGGTLRNPVTPRRTTSSRSRRPRSSA